MNFDHNNTCRRTKSSFELITTTTTKVLFVTFLHAVCLPQTVNSFTSVQFRPSNHRCSYDVTKIFFPVKKLSQADEERLLLSEPAMTAYIVAEMEYFLNQTMKEFDQMPFELQQRRKWKIPLEEMTNYPFPLVVTTENNTTTESVSATTSSSSFSTTTNYIDNVDTDSTIVFDNTEYIQAVQNFNNNSTEAIDLVVNITQYAIQEAYETQPGLWSALGSAILFFRDYYRQTPTLLAACERIGLSDYQIAHHITDMYHHCNFRGTYTKTLQPSGVGDLAARKAVGLEVEKKIDEKKKKQEQEEKSKTTNGKNNVINDDDIRDDDDECLCWSPTTPGVCLHWKSDDENWRKKRFERIQMEGTRDPRRGGSGTTR